MRYVVVILSSLFIASCGKMTSGPTPAVSSSRASVSVDETATVSPWVYREQVDPITKNIVATVSATLPSGDMETKEKVTMDITWGCLDRTAESTNVVVSTYLNKNADGNYVGLDQVANVDVEYRFDGFPNSITPGSSFSFVRLYAQRQYSNSVTLYPAQVIGFTIEKYIKKSIAILKPQERYQIVREIKHFYIVDPDFAVRIPTEAGDATAEFSVADPAIEKLLTACGFTYGQPPGRADAKDKAALSKSAEGNDGLDLDVPDGAALVSVAAGIVSWTGERTGYGLMVEIDHGNGMATRFNQNTRVLVRRGDLVRKGQEIAIAGPIVHSKGSHRRFEILKNGVQVDPLKFINENH